MFPKGFQVFLSLVHTWKQSRQGLSHKAFPLNALETSQNILERSLWNLWNDDHAVHDENLSNGCHSVKKAIVCHSQWMLLFEGKLLLEHNVTCGKYIVVTVELKGRGIHTYVTCR